MKAQSDEFIILLYSHCEKEREAAEKYIAKWNFGDNKSDLQKIGMNQDWDAYQEETQNLPGYEKERRGMERIYLELFRYNIHMDNAKDRDDYFMHVININEIQLDLAKELLESDLLTMYEKLSLFRRIGIWQILLMLLCFAL